MENEKNNKKVLLFSVVLIVLGYFVLDKLTRNYFNHHTVPTIDCSTITSGNPEEVAKCFNEREKQEAELNNDSSYLKEPNYSMKMKMIHEGVTSDIRNDGKNIHDNFLYFTRTDNLAIVYCSSNIPNFNITKTYIRLMPSRNNIIIACVDKLSKKPVFFADASISDKEIIEKGTNSLGDYSTLKLDQLVEY